MDKIEEKAEKYCVENELIDTSDEYTYADNTGTETKRAYIAGYKEAINSIDWESIIEILKELLIIK